MNLPGEGKQGAERDVNAAKKKRKRARPLRSTDTTGRQHWASRPVKSQRYATSSAVIHLILSSKRLI